MFPVVSPSSDPPDPFLSKAPPSLAFSFFPGPLLAAGAFDLDVAADLPFLGSFPFAFFSSGCAVYDSEFLKYKSTVFSATIVVASAFSTHILGW